MGKTSTAVKSRYNQKTYKTFSAKIKPEFYEDLIGFCKENNMSYSEFLKKALKNLKEEKPK